MYRNYYGYNQGYYPNGGAMPDNLAQLRGQVMPPSVPQCGNGIIWVLGEAEAKGYPVAPGSTVILWDRDTPTIFVKSADVSGIPSLKTFDLIERNVQPEPTAHTNAAREYITRDEFNERMSKLESAFLKEVKSDA